MEEALFKVLSFITFIMLGYLLRRLSILKAETFRVLSGIVFYITLPCIIITSINGVPVTSEMLWLVALGALCNVLMVATGYGMTHGKARAGTRLFHAQPFGLQHRHVRHAFRRRVPASHRGSWPPACSTPGTRSCARAVPTRSPTALPTPHSICPSRVSCATSFRPSLSASI